MPVIFVCHPSSCIGIPYATAQIFGHNYFNTSGEKKDITVNGSDSELLEFPGIKMKSAGCQAESRTEEDDETEIDQRELESDEELGQQMRRRIISDKKNSPLIPPNKW